MRFALTSLVHRSGPRGRAAAAAVSIPGGPSLLRRALPSGVAAIRPAGGQLLAWLHDLADEAFSPEQVILARSWRPASKTTVITVVDESARPALVAKHGSRSPTAVAALGETASLDALGDGARAAGAAVPRVLRVGSIGDEPVVLLTGVAGRTASSLIVERPTRNADVLERVAHWLERWNRATATTVVIDQELLEREVLEPAALVAGAAGGTLIAFAQSVCAEAHGSTTSLVAAHHDLTADNLLLDGDALGIVDWETARPASLPLADLMYLAVDVDTLADPDAARPGVFRDWFHPSGTRGERWRTLSTQVPLSPPIRRLAFLSCWLQHAADETVRDEPGAFVEIVRQIAAEPEAFNGI